MFEMRATFPSRFGLIHILDQRCYNTLQVWKQLSHPLFCPFVL